MSGQDAQRGFIYQTIVAMIECLDKTDWDAIKLEPETKNDKVDISFYANGKMLRAIQVKSSRKAFDKPDVEEWLKKTVNDADKYGAEEVCLFLVGNTLTKPCSDFVEELEFSGKRQSVKKTIKQVDYDDIKERCLGKLHTYIKSSGLGDTFTVSEVDAKYYILFGIVHENSISSRNLTRDEFREALDKNIRATEDRGKTLQIAKTVRKLSDNLWISWKTGRLGDSLESALYGGGKDECILDALCPRAGRGCGSRLGRAGSARDQNECSDGKAEKSEPR